MSVDADTRQRWAAEDAARRRPLTNRQRQDFAEGMILDLKVGGLYVHAYPMRCPHDDVDSQAGEVWLSFPNSDGAASHSPETTRALADSLEGVDVVAMLRQAADHAEFGPVGL